ncbi:MAG TPA: hypothetical protein VI814_05080 [Candidatus Limnocylindria bacterium]
MSEDTEMRDERLEDERAEDARDVRPRAGSKRADLFASDRAAELRSRWSEVQARFVDDPRAAVKEADGLVDDVIQQLAKQFADERARLEGQWGRDEKVSTEDLRVALQRYREFFERLLSM